MPSSTTAPQFGTGSLVGSVIGALDRPARATALMRHFGANPRAEFANDLSYFKQEWRNRDPN